MVYHPCVRDAPTGAIGLDFDTLGHIAVIMAHAKFYDNWFRVIGVLIPPILSFSIGIAGRPYNIARTVQ